MDILCQAKSGMGKTAVFVLATLQQIEPVDGQVSTYDCLQQKWSCPFVLQSETSICLRFKHAFVYLLKCSHNLAFDLLHSELLKT